MSQKYISARDKYNPINFGKHVQYLLIAESPPTSGGYFYFDRTTGKDSLFRETMKALFLFPEDQPMPTGLDKIPYLEAFALEGFFLVDATYEKVDDGRKRCRRREAIKKGMPRLKGELEKTDPRHIIIVKVGIFDIVRNAVAEANYEERLLNKVGLPFPGSGHQKEYRLLLREYLGKTGWTKF